MPQDDSENNIWDYKPLEKKRKGCGLPSVAKRRCTSRKTSKKDTSHSVKADEKSPKARRAERGQSSTSKVVDGHVDDRNSSEVHKVPSVSPITKDIVQSTSDETEGPTSEDFCPVCQMPFFILLVQSQRWHVAECLDTPRDKCKGTDIHTMF